MLIEKKPENTMSAHATGRRFDHRFPGQIGKAVTLSIVCDHTFKLYNPLG